MIDYRALISCSLFTFHQLNTLHIFAPLDNNVARIARLAADNQKRSILHGPPFYYIGESLRSVFLFAQRGRGSSVARVLTRSRGRKGNSVEKKEEEVEENGGLKLHRR